MTELRGDTQVSDAAEPEGTENLAQKPGAEENSAAATETGPSGAQSGEETDKAAEPKRETDKDGEDTGAQNEESVEPEAKRDDFTEYLKHEHETFTGPAREAWDAEQEARLKAQDEAERREAEAMAARAEAAKQAFLAQLAQKRNKPPPRADPAPQPDPDDLAGGWREVMRMVEPSGKQLPEKDVRQIKRLYFSLKDK